MTSRIRLSSQPEKNRAKGRQVTSSGGRRASTVTRTRSARTGSLTKGKVRPRRPRTQQSDQRAGSTEADGVSSNQAEASSTLVLSKGGRWVSPEQVKLATEIQNTIARSAHRRSHPFAWLLGRGQA